jgi:hypothetical protein
MRWLESLDAPESGVVSREELPPPPLHVSRPENADESDGRKARLAEPQIVDQMGQCAVGSGSSGVAFSRIFDPGSAIRVVSLCDFFFVICWDFCAQARSLVLRWGLDSRPDSRVSARLSDIHGHA